MRFVGYPKPHRHGGQHTGLVHLVVVLVQRKRESFLVGDPEAFVHQRLLLLKIFLQRLAHFLLAGHPRQIRKRAQRLRSQPALVELRLDGQQRPAFHPAVPHAKILWPSTFIIGRFQKRISLVQAFPLLFGKRRVAALDDVVVRRNDVQGSGIGGSVGIGIAFEPIHEIGALGNFVRDLAILALELSDELQRRP